MPLACLALLSCALAGSAPEASAAASGLRGDIRYRVAGGIAGVDERLLVRRDGRGRVTIAGKRRSAFRVSARERRALARAFEEADFATIPSIDPDAPDTPDALFYRVTYRGHSATTGDGHDSPRLDPIVRRLDRILERHRE